MQSKFPFRHLHAEARDLKTLNASTIAEEQRIFLRHTKKTKDLKGLLETFCSTGHVGHVLFVKT